MKKSNSVLYSLEALAVMLSVLNEAPPQGSEAPLEHGGILVGHRRSRIVTDAVLSSDAAERSPVSYFQTPEDVEHLSRHLRYFQSIGKDFLGYWHRHPSGLTRLSGGDLDTCRGILQDPDYKLDNRLIMTILTTGAPNRLPIYTYIVRLSGADLRVEEARSILLPQAHINLVTKHFGGQS